MATYSTNEFRPGIKVLLDGDPCSIVENEFVKPGKGQAFNRVRLRNLKTGRIWERTFKSGETLQAADVLDAEMEYLYTDGQFWHFMKTDGSFEQLAATNSEHKQSYRDERIKAVFAVAPVLGEAFTPQALQAISIPVCIVVGASDSQAVPERNAEHFARHIRGAQLTVLPAPVGHYVFLDECTDFGKQGLPMLCIDAPGVDRRAVHAQVSEMAGVFFGATLL